ncbi:hypothetical protein AB0E08_11020 [Streptomyces sp. NPDC048281]|uniref:hypothetical protein n=1 Tax=Streptomyces sp. NPDC048281 TaxID=3154715 RepID=UPI00343ADAA9
MKNPTTDSARTARAAVPGRRLIAAGVISRKVDVRITEAGVTGAIRKGAAR